jgi:hypothetical protein
MTRELGDSSDLLAQINQEAKPVQAEQNTQNENQQTNNVQNFARSKGHIDKEAWVAQGRDPELYIDEETWVKNHTFLNQINQLKKAVNYLVEQNKLSEDLGRQKYIEELKKRQVEAISNGDPDTITKITEQIVIEENKNKGIKADKVAPGTDPRVADFIERNKKWYNNDNANNAAARQYAISREDELAKTQPYLSIDERFKIVEDEVKKRFLANPATVESAAPVLGASHSSAPAKNNKFDASTLPQHHQDMIKTLRKTTKNFDEQRFIKLIMEIDQANLPNLG